MNSAGRILIIPKGEWDAETKYEMLDLVYHNGLSWVARKPANGIEPNDDNYEYWHKMFDISALPKNGGTLTGNASIKKDIPTLVLEVNESHSTTLHKNANSNIDEGTALIDKTDNVRTILTIKNGALRLYKQVNGVEVGSMVVAEIED